MPAGNVDGVEVFRHLSEHRGLQASIGVTGFLVLLQLGLVLSPTSQLERHTLNLPSRMFHSFFDCTLLGYSIFKLPRLATICSAVNGLLVYLHLESVHHCLTAATSSRNCCSSLFGSTAGFAILFAMVVEWRVRY